MVKKLGMLICVVALIAAVQPAQAAKKPVKTTLYLHGVDAAGELDGVNWYANGAPGTSPMKMDGTEPAAGPPKSMRYATPGLNTQCTGLPLGFPTWEGNINGTIVGDATLSLHFVSNPSRITARLWTDTPVFSCNEAYVAPASEVIVDVPAGQSVVDVVFPKLKLKSSFNVLIEILGAGVSGQGRVLYDSSDYASALTFKCIPASGSRC